MEAMASDEMDQDHVHKSGREELEATVQDQIRAKGVEIRERREEIRERREEIRAKEEEIRERREEISETEKKIAISSGTEVSLQFEAKLQFLRQEVQFLRQQISNLGQQICSRDQQIINLRQEINSLRQEALASAEPLMTVETMRKLLEDVMLKIVRDSLAKSAISFLSMSFVSSKVAEDILEMAGFCLVAGSDEEPAGDVSVPEGQEFDMGGYATEEDCYEPFFEHMVKYLTVVHDVKIRKDPPFPRGSGCCKLLDVHKKKKGLDLEAELDDRTFKITGNLDAVFVPTRRDIMHYKNVLLGGIEVKHLAAHKVIFKHGAPTVGTAKSGRSAIPGQALMEALAVYAHSDFPEGIFLLTSYDENVILKLKDREIWYWVELNFAQAMDKITAFLKGEGVQNILKEFDKPVTSREGPHISENKRSVRKKLKIGGLGNEEFLEQVDVIRSAAGSKVEMISDLFQLVESWRYSTTEACGSANPLSYFS